MVFSVVDDLVVGMVAVDIVALLVMKAFVDGVVVEGLGSIPSVLASLEVVFRVVDDLVVGMVAVDMFAFLVVEAFVNGVVLEGLEFFTSVLVSVLVVDDSLTVVDP